MCRKPGASKIFHSLLGTYSDKSISEMLSINCKSSLLVSYVHEPYLATRFI